MPDEVDYKEKEILHGEKSPLFGSWTAFYIAVVVWMGMLIAFFYFFTAHFS